jgi:hypothetical protein
MSNLLFIFYLLIIIIFMIIIITLFFNEFIIIQPTKLISKHKTQSYQCLIRNKFIKKKLNGCYRGKCVNGGYCKDCQGNNATCCCYDFQCSY